MPTETVSLILNLLILGVLFLGGVVLLSFFLNHIRDQNNRSVSREDIRELSNKIDRLEAQYAANFEQIRSELAARSTTSPVGDEAEYNNLSELWEVLLELQQATIDLTPANDQQNPEVLGDRIKDSQLRKFAESFSTLSSLLHKKRPFYPREIFEQLVELMTLGDTGKLKLHSDPPPPRGREGVLPYWESAVDSAEEIVIKIDNLCELIRSRITV